MHIQEMHIFQTVQSIYSNLMQEDDYNKDDQKHVTECNKDICYANGNVETRYKA